MQGVAPNSTVHDSQLGPAADMSTQEPLEPKKPNTSAVHAKRTWLMLFPWQALVQCACSLAGVSIGAWLLFGAGDTAK